MPRLFADVLDTEQDEAPEKKPSGLFADVLEPSAKPTEKPTTNPTGKKPASLFADVLEVPKTAPAPNPKGPSLIDVFGTAKQLFGPAIKATATLGTSLIPQEAPVAGIKGYQKLKQKEAKAFPMRQAVEEAVTEGLQPARQKLKELESQPRGALATGALTAAETGLQAGEFLVKQIPVTPTEVAEFAAGAAALGAGAKAMAHALPRLTAVLGAPVEVPLGVKTEFNTWLFRVKKAMGIPQETGLTVVDLRKAIDEGKVSLADAMRMDAKIYEEESAKRRLTPEVPPETPKTGPGLPPEPPEAVQPPAVAQQTPPAPITEAAGAIPGEVPKVTTLQPEAIQAEPEPTPINVAGTEISDKPTFEAIKGMVDSGELILNHEQKAFLDKMEAFWNFYPEAQTGIVQKDGTISPKSPGILVEPEISPIPEPGEPESIAFHAEEGNLANLTPEQFARRFPNAPPEAHKEIVRKALLSGKGASEEAIAAHPDLAVEMIESALNKPAKIETPLLDFVRRRGGIDIAKAEPYMGELESVKSTNIMRKKGGLGISDLAELAHQEGLLPEYSESVLLDSMDKEARRRAAGGRMGVGVAEDKIAFGGNATDMIREASQEAMQLEFDFDATNMPSSGIADRLHKKGFVDYRGTPVKNARQAAEIAATFRSPKVEHFQVLFIKKGVLVAHQVISSGMPDAAIIANRFKYQIQASMKRLGADQIYIAHNHPSGDPIASMEDRRTTVQFANQFGEALQGHIVTDDKQFSLIHPMGDYDVLDFEKPKPSMIPGGEKLNTPEKVVANTAKDFAKGKGVSVVFTDNRLRAIAVENVKPDADVQTYMRQRAVHHGASGIILVHNAGWTPVSKEKFPARLVDIISVGKLNLYSSMQASNPSKLEALKEPAKTMAQVLAEGPGYYRVQEAVPQYGREEFRAITAMKGIKPGSELTLSKPIMDPSVEGGKIARGTRVKVVDVDQDGQLLLIQHGQNYSTARLDDFIETRPVAQPPQKQIPVKQQIRQSTGLTTEDVVRKLKDMQLLKMKLQAMEKGANIGAREGARRMRATLLDKFRQTKIETAKVKGEVVDYLQKHLPVSERGKYVAMVKNAETPRDLTRAFVRIDARAADIYKKSLITDIKKLSRQAMESGNVATEYKSRIDDLLSDIELSGHTQRTIDKLRRTQEFIRSQESHGLPTDLPKHILDRVSILARRPVGRISEFELERILEDLKEIVAAGRKFQEVRQGLYVLRQQNIKTAILKGTKPIEASPILYAKPGEKLNLQQRLANFTAKASNLAQEMDLAIMQMDVAFDVLDGSPGYTGPNFIHIKKRLDGDWARFSERLREVEEPIRSLIEKYKLSEKNFDRIGVHADRLQPGGRDRLKASRDLTDSDIDAIVLTPQELEVYQKMRAAFDEALPEIRKKMAELYNVPVGEVPNYFPYIRDLEMMEEHAVKDRVLDAIVVQFRTKTVEKGFTKERVGGAKVPMVLNAWDRFSAHMRDVSYLLEMQTDIKMLFEIANSEEYRQAAGDLGQKMVLDWLDLMARSGGVDGSRKFRLLDILRNNMGAAQLGLRLSSILVQPTSLFDGAAFIGGDNVMRGLVRVLGQKEFRDFIYRNLQELRARVGDDPAFAEKGWLPGLQKIGFLPLEWADSITAAAVSGGAYLKKLEELGLPLDLSKPVPEAVEYATVILRRSQASPLFKDLGLAMSRGNVIGNRSVAKSIFQFQTFTLNRWSHFRYDVPRLFRNGDPAAAARMASYLLLATIAETGLRRGSQAMIAAALVGLGLTIYAKEDQDPFYKDVLFNLLDPVPFVGSFIRGGMYESYPIPVLNPLRDLGVSIFRVAKYRNDLEAIRATAKAVESLAGLTGIPGLSQIAQAVRIGIAGRKLPFPYSSELIGLRQNRKVGRLSPQDERRFQELRTAESEMRGYTIRFKSAIANGNTQVARREAEAALKAMQKYKR